MEQTRQRNSQGFTLIELLVVIAILGILSSGAVGAFQHITHTAKISSLDQSLTTVSTMTEANVLLENMSYPDALAAATIDAADGSSIEFAITTKTETSLIVQARMKGQVEPCRQLDILSGSPTDCDGSTDPVVKDPAPAELTPEAKAKIAAQEKEKAEAAAKAEETAKGEAETKEKGEAPNAETVAKEKAEAAAKAETEAAKEKDKPEASDRELAFQLKSGGSQLTWWDSWGRIGAWRADVVFSNAWIHQQYVDLQITVKDSNGETSTSTVSKFYVPAEGSSTYSLWDNSIRLDKEDNKVGVSAVTVAVTRVLSSDKDWKELSAKVDPDAKGASATVRWPEKVG